MVTSYDENKEATSNLYHDARTIVKVSLQLTGGAAAYHLRRSLAASIARLVLYVQLIQAAIAMEAVDQNRASDISSSVSQAELNCAQQKYSHCPCIGALSRSGSR